MLGYMIDYQISSAHSVIMSYLRHSVKNTCSCRIAARYIYYNVYTLQDIHTTLRYIYYMVYTLQGIYITRYRHYNTYTICEILLHVRGEVECDTQSIVVRICITSYDL